MEGLLRTACQTVGETRWLASTATGLDPSLATGDDDQDHGSMNLQAVPNPAHLTRRYGKHHAGGWEER